jgi:photosystem II stability/assembly factor-like uncharacterized protein/subtilisin-like proprotein convertase family protein
MKTKRNHFSGLFVAILCLFNVAGFSQHSGWYWQNPYLQGNDLNSIVMNGSIGWAVGGEGTVMKTSNEGFDWELIDLGTAENLNCIYMDEVSGRGWIVGNKGLIFYTEDGGNSWVKQRSGTTKILYSVTAITGDCPWISGNDIILNSGDHGQTWEWVPCIFHSHFFSIDLKDCDEAWVSGQQGMVISTSDEGVTWQSHSSGASSNLYCIDIVANGDYRACGYTGTIIRSSDAGSSWVKEYEKPFLYLYNVDTRGIGGPAYAVGGEGTILETLDGGTSWTQRVSGTYTYLNDVCFQAIMHGVYATGWYGIILRKEDGAGAEFAIMNERPLHMIQGIDFIDENTGWAVGGEEIDDGVVEGVILHTSDGGENWEVQATLDDGLMGVDFINASEGWVVGNNGIIRHTSNGGATWGTQTSPMAGLLTAVFFVDEENGWIVSRDNWGEIAHTSNGGNTWTLQEEPSQNPLNDVFFINASKGWVVGMDSTIMRTNDGGLTWLKCSLEVSNNPYLRSVQFLDETTGWAVGTSGFILKSEDGGITWRDVHSGFGELLQSVYFTDLVNGWAAGVDGTILRTIDGGESWFTQYTGVERNYLTCVHFANTMRGWTGGEGGTIKRTDNGGFGHEPGVFIRDRRAIPIVDLATVKDTLRVKVMDFRESGYELTGVEVFLDSLLHQSVGDLVICLSHGNVTDTIVRQVPGPGQDFLWNRLTDDASIKIEYGQAPFSGNYRPYQSLNAFTGLDPDGDWILSVFDTHSGNTGTLIQWGIKPLYERLVSVVEPGGSPVAENILILKSIPNPFRNTTRISWESKSDGFTTLEVFSASGQLMETIVSNYLQEGAHSVEFASSGYGPGVYYFRLQVGMTSCTEKFVIIK